MFKASNLLAMLALLAVHAIAQSDRGTITGTVADPGGALIPDAKVVATNAGTGVQFATATTATGNYTIPSVPSGAYEVSVEAQGFRRHLQSGVTVQVANTARIDVVLQIGSTSESVNVTADAPLLQTENAAQSTTITGDQINSLPLNFAIGQGAVRNPLSFVQLAPGASINGWNDIRVNGAPSNTFRIIFEGQDTTSALNPRVSDESQASVEALQEFTLQSSNFSAEFGQVGGGLFNFTSRSGGNAVHGSLYEYFVNEKLNARNGLPNPGFRPTVRRHDFGGSIGGPVVIPKLYNGKDRTFFFFNYERYRNVENKFNGLGTLPTDAMRNGDFSAILTGRVLGTDGLGRPILENSIYDPTTARNGPDGRVYTDPFPNNLIPRGRFDAVSANVQALVPRPTNSGLINNFERRYTFRKIQAIPSIKIDHSLTDKIKMSGYYSPMATDKDNGQDDGLPDPISPRRDQIIRSHTIRVNYDQTLTPTMLLHTGVGYQRYNNPDASPKSISEYDASQLGFRGQVGSGFPRLTGLSNAFGGLPNIGPTNRTFYFQDKPTFVASMTWVKGNHTYKWGGDWRLDTFTNRSEGGVAGSYAFSLNETGLPALQTNTLSGGSIGHPYASFLLGRVNNASLGNVADPQYRRTSWALFAQDTWKLTRKLTLDYGVRWDIQNPAQELHNRTSMFAPDISNPRAGGLLGATIYEGQGAGRCNCTFVKTYPWAIGPRLGVAYQLNEKTVIRAGWAVSYAQLTGFNYIGGGNSQGMGFNSIPFSSPAFAEPAMLLAQGFTGRFNPNDLFGASYDPALRTGGALNSATAHLDRNGGRPPRQIVYNFSIQRELFRNLAVEAAYVGNRGAWFRADGLIDYNAVTPERLRAYGLDVKNAGDRTLLTSPISAAPVQARGFRAPYAGFPTGATLAQALRPFPQFTGIGSMWAPLGNNWYDSLQAKATKRYSHGLDFSVAYTWSKTLTTVEDQSGEAVPTNDVFNRPLQKSLSREDQPHVLVTAFNYTVPAAGWFGDSAWKKQLFAGWTLGGILRYSSGKPIRVPTSQNNLGQLLFRSTNANRVAGEPLFLRDLNCGCIDPNADFALNPKAWSDPAAGEWGTAAAYYSDYRYARRPDEQISLGKIFRVKERMSLSVRAEFFNMFNRLHLNNPDNGNALLAQSRNSAGVPTSGFGRINQGGVFGDRPARSGQLVARFQF